MHYNVRYTLSQQKNRKNAEKSTIFPQKHTKKAASRRCRSYLISPVLFTGFPQVSGFLQILA